MINSGTNQVEKEHNGKDGATVFEEAQYSTQKICNFHTYQEDAHDFLPTAILYPVQTKCNNLSFILYYENQINYKTT